jgi:hypothetical protein
MRQYNFQATDDTADALRRLRAPWRGLQVADDEILVALEDGDAVRIGLDEADVEGLFDAYRITAETRAGAGIALPPIEDFFEGRNDVVLFTGATWSEDERPGADGKAMHYSGHLGQLSDTAAVVCITTDAVVVASSDGRGLLIRTGLRPGTLEVDRDPERLRDFLTVRGYTD